MIKISEKTVRGVRSLRNQSNGFQHAEIEPLLSRRLRDALSRTTARELPIDFQETAFKPVIRHRG
jgi:hypothetical protein